MTTDIDRTIEKLKLVVEKMKVVGDSNYWTMKEHEQIAEWLEELKELRVAYYKGFKEGKRIGYNKAIDDFEKEMIRSYLTEREKEYIRYKAEQLKEGGE